MRPYLSSFRMGSTRSTWSGWLVSGDAPRWSPTRCLLSRDALACGGYSACVLAPSLRGLETVDDAGAVPRIYGAGPVWEGLGVLDHAMVPHYQSPDHPEAPRARRSRTAARRPGLLTGRSAMATR